jgi:hypothetical protein
MQCSQAGPPASHAGDAGAIGVGGTRSSSIAVCVLGTFSSFDRTTLLFGGAWPVAGLLVAAFWRQSSLPLGASP